MNGELFSGKLIGGYPLTNILYTGVKVIQVNKKLIDEFYFRGEIEASLFGEGAEFDKHQNMFVILKDETPKEQGGAASALARVEGDKLIKLFVSNKTCISSIYSRNKEQLFAFDALANNEIRVVALTGIAGTGKTILAIAAALQQVEEKKYDRIILTRPMTQVGKNTIGFLPGDLYDKFLPFNQGYLCNFERLLGDKSKTQTLMEQLPIDFIPLQLVRGASWDNSFIILDEAQNTTHHEILTFGTRIGEGSKVVILGDLQQRDVQLSKEATGIYKLVNSPLMKESSITASVELMKCERGEVAKIFSKVFEEEI
jgi:PhoH-like ATPase